MTPFINPVNQQKSETSLRIIPHTQLTNVAVLSLPARLTDAGPVMALAVLFTARMARSLITRGANPALLTLTLAL